jgi:hypothetical protein
VVVSSSARQNDESDYPVLTGGAERAIMHKPKQMLIR